MAPFPLILLRSFITEPINAILILASSLLPAPLATATIPTLLKIDTTHSHSYQPHPDAPFEGYYTRLTTPNGATVLIIFSSVRNARPEHKPHLLQFSYIPQNTENGKQALIFNLHPKELVFVGEEEERRNNGGNAGNVITVTAKSERGGVLGTYMVNAKGESIHQLRIPVEDGFIEVDVKVKVRKPWGGELAVDGNGPEGIFAALIHLLPLHWFVWSVSSTAELSIRKTTPGYDAPQVIYDGEAKAHVEKNWGRSFPTGWVWIESLAPTTLLQDSDVTLQHEELDSPPYVVLAGGSTLGIKAFLLGFSCPPLLEEPHSPSSPPSISPITWSFRPIFTILLPIPFSGGRYVSPFCQEKYNSHLGTYTFSVIDWSWAHGWRKVILTCRGSKAESSSCDENTTTGGYVKLPCPMSHGHDNEFAKETFDATVLVEAYVWERKGWLERFSVMEFGAQEGWRKVAGQEFRSAALEWGGEYWGGKTVEGGACGWLGRLFGRNGREEEGRKKKD